MLGDARTRQDGEEGTPEPFAGPERSVPELVADAKSALEAGEPERAVNLFRQCVAKGARLPRRALMGFAQALRDSGQPAEAVSVAEQVLERMRTDRDRARVWMLIATCRFELGDAPGQETALRKAVGLAPSPDAYVFLFDALVAQGRDKEAVDCLHEALALDPDDEEAHYNLGCWYRDDAPDTAEGHLRKAIELDPNYARAHAELGWLLRNRELLDEAIEVLLRAVECDPAYVWARIYLGNTFWHAGRVAEAEEHFRAAVRIQPPFGPAHWLCAEFLDATVEDLEPWSRAHARQDEIDALFRKAIELDPEDPLARYNYGLYLWQEERDDEALDEMRTAAELGSDRAVNWLADNTMSGAYRSVRRTDQE